MQHYHKGFGLRSSYKVAYGQLGNNKNKNRITKLFFIDNYTLTCPSKNIYSVTRSRYRSCVIALCIVRATNNYNSCPSGIDFPCPGRGQFGQRSGAVLSAHNLHHFQRLLQKLLFPFATRYFVACLCSQKSIRIWFDEKTLQSFRLQH